VKVSPVVYLLKLLFHTEEKLKFNFIKRLVPKTDKNAYAETKRPLQKYSLDVHE